jgi:hypothetical protein
MSENWSEEQRLYMDWQGLPKDKRTPKTEEEFAQQIGVTDRTLRRWKQLPGFWDGVRNEARANLKAAIGRIYHALIAEAEGGSFQHLKLALEMLNEHTDRVEVSLRDEVVELIQFGMVDYQSVKDEFGEEMAQDFFAAAQIEPGE